MQASRESRVRGVRPARRLPGTPSEELSRKRTTGMLTQASDATLKRQPDGLTPELSRPAKRVRLE
jgi:hypothetical protein